MTFRPLRRTQKAIPDEAAREILRKGRRAVLAMNGDDGYPYAIPLNYLYDEENNRIYFHGARAGHKVDSLRRSDKVCFTVIGEEWLEEGDWAPYIRSTVIFGRCRLIDTTPETTETLRRLARKYYSGEDEVTHEIEKSGAAAQLYELEIEHLCGKQIQEK